jgi:hypothetical protein
MAFRVECYIRLRPDALRRDETEDRGEESPRAIIIDERRVEVVEILDRWLAPDHRYFKVKGTDGDVYIVRHDAAADAWELTMFQRHGATI